MAKSNGRESERVSEEAKEPTMKGEDQDESKPFICCHYFTSKSWTIEPLFSWSVCKSASYFPRPSLLLEMISLSDGSNTCQHYKDSAIMKNLGIIFH